MPWTIRFDDSVAARFAAEPFVRERVGDAGLAVIARGMLPTRVEARRLQCVFLDEDELCSLQKRFGHAYLPAPCQSFPFSFVADEHGASIAQLSRLCPSIRDHRGAPVLPMLPAKLAESGGAARLTHRMATLSGVMLGRPQFLKVAATWAAHLAASDDLASTLARLVELTHALERGLEGGEYVADATLDAALAAAEETSPATTPPRATSYWARLFFAFTLGNLAYPSRLRQPDRVDPPVPFEGLRALWNKLVFLFERGRVDLLLLPARVALGGLRRVRPVLGRGPCRRSSATTWSRCSRAGRSSRSRGTSTRCSWISASAPCSPRASRASARSRTAARTRRSTTCARASESPSCSS
jgi:lysine-N-methylase